MPKYSVLVPCYNGMPYIKNCLDNILSQNYDDFELIVSDNCSNDGSAEFLESINSKKVKILHTKTFLSMAEHWDFIQSYASGDWQIFVGIDDGLQKYFFQLADKLTKLAERKHIKVIMSERAYYFWPGCEKIYGDIKIQYKSLNKIKVKKSKREFKRSLFKINHTYFVLPEMYTTSLFHKDIIDKSRSLQNGKLFITHPQDANLAALSCILEKKYLYSCIPLSWVGSSSKSAGYVTTMGTKDNISEELVSFKENYIKYQKSIETSNLTIAENIGYNLLFSNHTCLWNSGILVNSVANNNSFKFLNKKITAYKIIITILMEHNINTITNFDSVAIVDLIKRNNININVLLFLYFLNNSFSFFLKLLNYPYLNFVEAKLFSEYSYKSSDIISMNDVNELIYEKNNKQLKDL